MYEVFCDVLILFVNFPENTYFSESYVRDRNFVLVLFAFLKYLY